MRCNYCNANITSPDFVIDKFGTYCDKSCAEQNIDTAGSFREAWKEFLEGQTHDILTLWDNEDEQESDGE